MNAQGKNQFFRDMQSTAEYLHSALTRKDLGVHELQAIASQAIQLARDANIMTGMLREEADARRR